MSIDEPEYAEVLARSFANAINTEDIDKITKAMKAIGETAENAVQVKVRAESGKELRRQRRAEARANAKRPKTPNYTEFAFNTLKARRAADPTFRNIRNENGEHV